MNHRRYILPSIAALLLTGAWWFCLAVFSSLRSSSGVYEVFPVIIAALAFVLLFVGRRKSLPGSMVGAAVLFAVSVIFFGFSRSGPDAGWWFGWALLPAVAGVSILIENGLGIGWRYTDGQALGLILFSLGLISVIFLLPSFLRMVPQENVSILLGKPTDYRFAWFDFKGLVLLLKTSLFGWR